MLKVYPSWFLFITLNLSGLLIVIGRSNWLSIWVGFELSAMGFIPIFIINGVVNEGLVKYFLIQAMGSSILILSFIMDHSYLASGLFSLSIIVKLGVFPFYQWIPLVIVSLRWVGCFLLSTIQKLGPILMVSKGVGVCRVYILVAVSRLRVLLAGLLGVNQYNLKALIAYSSISHTGWILLTAIFREALIWIYMLLYFSAVYFLFVEFHKSRITAVIDKSKSGNEVIKVNFGMIVISGIPPFSVFLIKVLILLFLVDRGNYLLLAPLLLGAVLSIYFYLSIIITRLIKSWNLVGREGSMIGVGRLVLFLSVLLPAFLLIWV